MRARSLAEAAKLAHFGWNFLHRRLVHTNLQILYDCNYRCRICDFWRPSYRGRHRLSVDEVRVIAERLRQIGPQIVSIGGGEPLLHQDLVGIARTLARDHMPVVITNGWHVTPEIARELWRAGLYEISVSVDYADPAKHDAQRGVPGAHARALAALETLLAARTRPFQRVHMICVVGDDNLDEIEPLLRWCEAAGLTFLVTLYSDARGQKPRALAAPGASKRLLALKARYPAFVSLRGYLARFADVEQGGIARSCRAGLNLLNVDCDGSVSLCIDGLDEPVGNLLRDDAAHIRERLRDRARSNTCRACWTSCRGSIESLMDGPHRIGNLLDYIAMTRPVAVRPHGSGG